MIGSEEMDNVFDDVAYRMDAEGFDYCFDGYSNWEEIEDEEFHRLRRVYLEAKRELEEYVLENTDEEYK